MKSTDRRTFLRLCAQSVSALALSKGAQAGGGRTGFGTPAPSRTPQTLDRFIDPLPIPSRVSPVEVHKDKLLYRIRMEECKQQMHSQLPASRLWGYEGQYPGPIFEATRGMPIEVEWENHLPTQHIFAIDPHIHGAMPPSPAVRTVPHLHGARTESASDGLPEKWFVPGASARYFYPNKQQAATLWYHDHALGITRLNVYAGLSGFYFLRDSEERDLGLPAGDYEIPLLLQDRTLDAMGQLVYAPTHENGVKLPPGVWGPEFFGELPVLNGAIYPHLDVEPRPYRLRVLNGANSRFFNLYFNLAKSPTDIPSLVPFHQIGSDGGFLPKTVPLTRILLGPAERADLIVDFTGLEGKTITVSNDGSAPYPGWEMMASLHAPLDELMQVRVTLPLKAKAKAIDLAPANSFTRFEESLSVLTRDFLLTEKVDAQGHSLGVRINDKGYDEPVTEITKLGQLEKWRFINTTDDAHPMHLHLVQFQILERQGFDPPALTQGRLELVGRARPPAPNEAGWKDTAIVNPRDVLTILVRFEGFTGRFVFHCHMLEHEDNDMMRPFEVVS
ncbi:MAG TPA: multicopper oxidase domain-containing protein [Terracidiphilus sp.]|jgi:spore coat protein A, manganese oxidase